MPNIFNYQDYRKFLGDYYEEKKASNSAFSYQNFSRKAGFASKSFVFNVINGRKNLSRASVVKMCQAQCHHPGDKLGKQRTQTAERPIRVLCQLVSCRHPLAD